MKNDNISSKKLSMGKDTKIPDHRQPILWPNFQHVKDLSQMKFLD